MDVIFYSTHCSMCNVLEKKLKAKNIDYTEINDTDIMMGKGIMTAPCLEVDGNIMKFGEAVKWVNEQE